GAVDVVDAGLEGVRCRLVGPDGSAPLRLRVPGLHTVRNACAAAAVAGRHGVGIAEAAERLAAFEAPPQRGVVSRGAEGAVIVEAAVAAGMPADCARVAGDVDEAARLARAQCDPGTVVLVKASHGVALERVVERLLR